MESRLEGRPRFSMAKEATARWSLMRFEAKYKRGYAA